MTGNTFGKIFKVTTFGESHGKAIGAIIDGCPPGLRLDEGLLQPFLDRRRPGQSRYTSQRREADKVEILSGVFEGKTTGTPISLLLLNNDAKARNYDEIKDLFRPGHGDYTYHHKYKIRDYRGGGRASARETAARVAAGAVASLYLKEFLNIQIQGYLSQIGEIKISCIDKDAANNNPFFCPDPQKISTLEQYINTLRKEGDSIGAKIIIEAKNVPVGLGDPVFDKLDATLAYALMSIPAVKGVEIGAGFNCVEQRGSEHRDEISKEGFLSNNAGGILGGISTGQDIIITLALKPAASIVKSGKTIDIHNQEVDISTKGRHDPCVGLRAVPIAESMVSLVLMDHYLRNKAQNMPNNGY